jgi:hypothetical protein
VGGDTEITALKEQDTATFITYMKQRFILILLIACALFAGCSSGSVIENKPISTAPDAEIDSLFESKLPGPSLPPGDKPGGIFCLDYTGRGLLRICYKGEAGAKLKLMITPPREPSDGSGYIAYNLKGDGSIEDFPLQFGSGEYTANIMEQTEGDYYVAVETETFTANIEDENAVFLNSVQNINWNYDMAPIHDVRYIVADSLRNSKDDVLYSSCLDIYGYIVNNITYDNNKIYDLEYDYVPDVEQIYSGGTGICYDYASLFAAMLRSVSIPAKLVKGYAGYNPDTYHAWNEVFINGEWITVDPTRDATLLASGVRPEIEKNSADYTKINEY